MEPERWADVDRLYHAALARDRRERAAFVAEACLGDDALRHEVESLLVQESRAAGFMSTPAAAMAGATSEGGVTSFTGQRIGAYEIESLLGAGGMGDVYRARDTRLDRTVAIKILHDVLAGDSQTRERFDREARAISQLDHPNICALYDVGEHQGAAYLVMQYLEGETLQDRLAKGALPSDQALTCAMQIAAALDQAHRAGIVHRDLKPGNIMLTKSGAKLLDFGLAKRAAPMVTGATPSTRPPSPPHLTAPGTILGTLQYMAPEQLEAKDADARTDIFAFGAVVYEMLTGKEAFQGSSRASLISAILHDDPALLSTIRPLTPPALSRVIKTCLAKDPDDRWQSARDMGRALKDIAEQPFSTHTITAAGAGTRWRGWISRGLVAAAVLLAATALTTGALRPRSPDEPHAYRSTLLLPANLSGVPSSRLALSPDGRHLAFVATSESGQVQLWVRALDGLAAEPLVGTEGAQAPFWSPNGRSLAFFADGKLKKIDIAGGPAVPLCDARVVPNAVPGAWSRDEVIVFNASTTMSPLSRVSAGGGTAEVITALDRRTGEAGHTMPSFLPDGQHFLYGAQTSSGRVLGLYVGSLTSIDRTRLLDGVSHAIFAQGRLLFLRGTTLMAQSFDAGRRVLTGEPEPVGEQVQTDPSWRGAFAASDTGLVVYQAGATPSRLLWYDRRGRQTAVLGNPAHYDDVFLSPDGRHASVSVSESGSPNRAIWTLDVASGIATRMTFEAGEQFDAPWSDDGRLIFDSSHNGHQELFLKPANGADAEALLTDGVDKYAQSWSPDGRFLIYMVWGATTGQDLWMLPLTGDRKPAAFLETSNTDGGGQFSPDGRWIAYWSNRTGRLEVFVASFPGPGRIRQVSTSGGIFPRWRRDGKEIFYRSPDNMLMAATVNGQGPNFEVRAVRPLFGVRPGGPHWFYDVAPDGEHFLVNTAPEQTASAPITLVVNWPAALKR